MKSRHAIGRRSFLARVTGGTALFGSLAAVSGAARAQVTDSDPGDPVGGGRGGGTGITDSDSGPNADRGGRGRGGTGSTGGTGITDSDSGAGADPAGRGRGGTGSSQATRISDSDSGPSADPAGQGRGQVRGQSQACEDLRREVASLEQAVQTNVTEEQIEAALADLRELNRLANDIRPHTDDPFADIERSNERTRNILAITDKWPSLHGDIDANHAANRLRLEIRDLYERQREGARLQAQLGARRVAAENACR